MYKKLYEIMQINWVISKDVHTSIEDLKSAQELPKTSPNRARLLWSAYAHAMAALSAYYSYADATHYSVPNDDNVLIVQALERLWARAFKLCIDL